MDLFGLPADYEAIGGVAARHGLKLIEDAAQSFGGEYKGERPAPSVTSPDLLLPRQALGLLRRRGDVFHEGRAIDEVLRSLRVHGQGSHKYDNVRIGINGRLDTLQAAILLAKFEIFPEEIGLRQGVAADYNELLAGVVATPQVPEGYQSAWAQYSIVAGDSAERAELMAKLKAAGIPTAIYYPNPLHLQGPSPRRVTAREISPSARTVPGGFQPPHAPLPRRRRSATDRRVLKGK